MLTASVDLVKKKQRGHCWGQKNIYIYYFGAIEIAILFITVVNQHQLYVVIPPNMPISAAEFAFTEKVRSSWAKGNEGAPLSGDRTPPEDP